MCYKSQGRTRTAMECQVAESFAAGDSPLTRWCCRIVPSQRCRATRCVAATILSLSHSFSGRSASVTFQDKSSESRSSSWRWDSLSYPVVEDISAWSRHCERMCTTSSCISINSRFSSGQEAQLEIQQLCEHYKWLVDIHLFISQWSRASLESMRGEPASRYEEHIKKMRNWAEGIDTVPSSISSSNQLFIIHCTHIKETLGMSALH